VICINDEEPRIFSRAVIFFPTINEAFDEHGRRFDFLLQTLINVLHKIESGVKFSVKLKGFSRTRCALNERARNNVHDDGKS
jgi:hypothetical protein